MPKILRYLLAASVAVTIAAPTSVASAAPPTAPPSGTAATAATSSVDITLITGDRVHRTVLANGRSEVTVASRTGALTANFSKHEADGHTYVVPADVSALVPSKLDWSLFDVTLLAQSGNDDASANSVPVVVQAAAGAGAPALPGATVTGTSGSTATMAISKANAADLGAKLAAAAVAAPGTATLLDGIARISLDGATADGPSTRTTPDKTVTLTVKGIARDGRPAYGISSVDVINVDNQSLYRVIGAAFTDGTATFSVPTGHYAVLGYIFTYDDPQVYATEAAATFKPEVNITKSTTVTLDARDSVPIQIDTKDPVEATTVTLAYYRTDALGASYEHTYTVSAPINKYFANPTDPVTIGDFEFYSQFSMVAPDIAAKVVNPENRPIDADYVFNSAKLDGSFLANLVYVGLGRVEDYDGLNVKGKVVLIQRGEITFLEKMQNAEAAGAKLAMIYNNVPGLLLISGDPSTIPTMSMTQAEGEALKALTDKGKVIVQVDAVAVSPYLYDLVFPEPNRIPGTLHYVVDDSTSATEIDTYRAHVRDQPEGELRHKWRPWEISSFGTLRQMTAPLTRTEYISAGDGTQWQHHFYGYSTVESPFNLLMVAPIRTYDAGQHLTDAWMTQVIAPAAAPAAEAVTDSAAYRTGDNVVLNIPEWVDREGHWGFADPVRDTTAFRLYQDGEQVGSALEAHGSFPVAGGPSTLRLELDADRDAPGWLYSTSTSTTWTVKSDTTEQAERLPLLNVTFDANVTMLNKLAGGKKGRALAWTVDHQAGSDDSAVTGSKLWISYDDGNTWKKVKVTSGGAGKFSTKLPKAPESATTISLKVSASDADGGSIDQDIVRAFGLGK